MKTNFKRCFTLMEVMMALLVVSIILAVTAPVITSTYIKREQPQIQVQSQPADTLPVGIIAVWYGSNYPKGWIPLNGQPIEEKYYELKTVIGADTLPDLNEGKDPTGTTTWIIKAQKVQ